MSKAQTEKFKDEIKKIFSEALGVDVKKQQAWDLFKKVMETGVELCLQETSPKKSFTLSGIGKFRINQGKAAGKRAEAFNLKTNPSPKFTFSLPFRKRVFEFYNLPTDYLVPTTKSEEEEK